MCVPSVPQSCQGIPMYPGCSLPMSRVGEVVRCGSGGDLGCVSRCLKGCVWCRRPARESLCDGASGTGIRLQEALNEWGHVARWMGLCEVEPDDMSPPKLGFCGERGCRCEKDIQYDACAPCVKSVGVVRRDGARAVRVLLLEELRWCVIRGRDEVRACRFVQGGHAKGSACPGTPWCTCGLGRCPVLGHDARCGGSVGG